MNLEIASIFPSCSFRAFFLANLVLTSWMSSSNSFCLSKDFLSFISFLLSTLDILMPVEFSRSSAGFFFFHDHSISCLGLSFITSASLRIFSSFLAKVRAAGMSFFFIGTPCATGIGSSSLDSNLLLTEFRIPPLFTRGSFCFGWQSSFLINNSLAFSFTDPIFRGIFLLSSSSNFF